jgi:hypothetical protein
VWCRTPALASSTVRHGQGYSVISHQRGDLRSVNGAWTSNIGQASLVVIIQGIERSICGRWHCRMDDGCQLCGPQHSADRVLPGFFEGSLTVLLASQRERAAGFGEGLRCVHDRQPTRDDWTVTGECFDPQAARTGPLGATQRFWAGRPAAMKLTPGASGERVSVGLCRE